MAKHTSLCLKLYLIELSQIPIVQINGRREKKEFEWHCNIVFDYNNFNLVNWISQKSDCDLFLNKESSNWRIWNEHFTTIHNL